MASSSETKSSTKSDHGRQIGEARTRMGQVIEIAFSVVAALLVIGAILVLFRDNINNDNPLVKLVLNVADTFDGPLSRDDGIFQFSGKHAISQEAVTNWGLAAVIYVVVGRIVGRIVRP